MSGRDFAVPPTTAPPFAACGFAAGFAAGARAGAAPPFIGAPQNGHSTASSSRTDCLHAGQVGRSILPSFLADLMVIGDGNDVDDTARNDECLTKGMTNDEIRMTKE